MVLESRSPTLPASLLIGVVRTWNSIGSAEVVVPLGDAFWGDRYGQVRDPVGQVWAIAAHTEDLTPEEMQKRSAEFFVSMKR